MSQVESVHRERRTRGSGGGIGIALGVLVLVALIVVAVLYVAGMRYRVEAERAAAAEAHAMALAAEQRARGGARETGVADPFADVPDRADGDPFATLGSDEPRRFSPLPPGADPDDPFASLGPDPRANAETFTPGLEPRPGELTGSALWQEALEIAERAFRLMTEAVGTREQGDEAGAKRLRRQALAQFDRALMSTASWVEGTVSKFDPRDVQVRSVRRSVDRWTEQTRKLRAAD